MTGSARNSSGRTIETGSPIAEDQNGNVLPAGVDSIAFAVCTAGTPGNGITNYATDGTVTRGDWSAVAGTKTLVPGQQYYAADNGMISTSGQQQIGVARSATVLRIGIGPSIAPMTPQIVAINSPPTIDVGNPGDYAYNPATRQWYGPKTKSGWTTPPVFFSS